MTIRGVPDAASRIAITSSLTSSESKLRECKLKTMIETLDRSARLLTSRILVTARTVQSAKYTASCSQTQFRLSCCWSMYRVTAGAAAGHAPVPSGAVMEFLGKLGISGNGCPGWRGSDELSRDIAIAMGKPLLRSAC